jgi:hypothetical protein
MTGRETWGEILGWDGDEDRAPEVTPSSGNGHGHAAETPTGPSVPKLPEVPPQEAKADLPPVGAAPDPRPPKPSRLPFNSAGIPESLMKSPFVCVRDEWKEDLNKGKGGWSKVPKNPTTGSNALPNDLSTGSDLIGRITPFAIRAATTTASESCARQGAFLWT